MLTDSARDRARVAREGLVARPLAAAGRGAARGRTTRSGRDAAACEENMRESINRSFQCSTGGFRRRVMRETSSRVVVGRKEGWRGAVSARASGFPRFRMECEVESRSVDRATRRDARYDEADAVPTRRSPRSA